MAGSYPELSVALVTRLVRRLRSSVAHHVDPDELLSDGLMGLLDAQRRFDAQRGVPFIGFAVARIRGAMLDGLRRRRARRAVFSLRESDSIGCDRRADHRMCLTDTRIEMNRLTRRQRLGITLHYLEGLSLRHTGAVLGISEAGAGMLLGRALRTLRESKEQPRGRRGPRGRHFSPHSTPDHR